jgi:hypothetical protein
MRFGEWEHCRCLLFIGLFSTMRPIGGLVEDGVPNDLMSNENTT